MEKSQQPAASRLFSMARKLRIRFVDDKRKEKQTKAKHKLSHVTEDDHRETWSGRRPKHGEEERSPSQQQQHWQRQQQHWQQQPRETQTAGPNDAAGAGSGGVNVQANKTITQRCSDIDSKADACPVRIKHIKPAIVEQERQRQDHRCQEWNDLDHHHWQVLFVGRAAVSSPNNSTSIGQSLQSVSSSVVFFRHLKTNRVVVGRRVTSTTIDCVFNRRVNNRYQNYQLNKEKKFWYKVRMHPNFYPLLGVVEAENRFFLLTENIPSTTLQSLISDNNPLREEDVKVLMAQLVLAVAHLQENGIVHRNIIPEKIAVDWHGRLRITDLSTCEQRGCSLASGSDHIKFPLVAPEILKGACYDVASDWWNVGCCFYEMITGRQIYAQYTLDKIITNMSKQNCKEAINDIVRMPIDFPQEISKSASNLLNQLLDKDPNKRLKWDKSSGVKLIKEHEFFAGVDWDRMSTESGVGCIQMDLSFSTWSSENTIVEQILGDDYGYLLRDCHVIKHKKTGESAILKLVWKAQMQKTPSGWKRVMNERLAWQKVSGHPLMVSMKGFFETEACYCFVLEHVPEAVSLSVVIKSAPLQENVVKVMSGQLASVLNFLHQNDIIHRSLSPDGVLVEKSGRIKFCDFENAKFAKWSGKAFGDCTYMAPEIIEGKKFSREADWWAFGIIVLEMLVGSTPLGELYEKNQLPEEDLGADVLLKALDNIPKLLSRINSLPAQKLLEDFLTLNPEERLGFKRQSFEQAIRCHPFYKGLKWKLWEKPGQETNNGNS